MDFYVIYFVILGIVILLIMSIICAYFVNGYNYILSEIIKMDKKNSEIIANELRNEMTRRRRDYLISFEKDINNEEYREYAIV